MVRFLALAHMVGATQHHVPCTCTHGWCYVSHGMGWGGDDNVPCTCTHGRCYATSWDGVGLGWGGVGMITFLALAHMVGATQVMGLGWGGVGMITFLALAHMVGATQVMGLGWGGVGMITKIVILPHKSHVSHKYKCMNDGFLINQHADQKKIVRAEHNSM